MDILKKLEERRITAEEAARLLDSLKYKESTTTNNTTYNKDVKKEYSYDDKKNNSSNNNTSSQSSKFDDFASEMSRKFQVLATDLEPKLMKLTETIVEGTVTMADKLSKSIQSHKPTDTYKEPSRSGTYKTSTGVEKTFELKVLSPQNQLNLTAINGNILIRGYNGDKITAKIYFKAKKSGANIDFLKLGSKYYLDYNEEDFNSISIDAFIPESLFNNIIIETNNGEINISSLKTENILIKNSTGKTEINNLNSKNIKVECDNNFLSINNLVANYACIENFNGDIAVTSFDVEKSKVSTFNGSVNLNIPEFKKFNNYIWDVESSNGKLIANLPMSNQLGYYISASTTLGNIKVGLVGLDYLKNNANFVEAKSINYDSCEKNIMLKLQTSNAQLIIN